MQNEKLKTVPREKASKYVEYYKTIYDINEQIQPNFWEAVIMLCENPNCNINLLNINNNEEGQWCVSGYNISKYGVKTVLELAQKISKDIIQTETTPIDPLEIMLIKAKLEELEGTVKFLEFMNSKF